MERDRDSLFSLTSADHCRPRRGEPRAAAWYDAAPLQPLYICAGRRAKATDRLVNGPELMTAHHTILSSGRGALTTLFLAAAAAPDVYSAANAADGGYDRGALEA